MSNLVKSLSKSIVICLFFKITLKRAVKFSLDILILSSSFIIDKNVDKF